MKNFYSYVLLSSLLLLTACAEAQFGSHIAKSVYPDRSQGSYKVGKPYLIDGQEYYPREQFDYTETGIASWYGPGFHGKQTANGERYDQNELTAAHKTLQMPSLVRVTNLENGRSLVVRVNDRGPYSRGRIIDMSSKGADLLGFKGKGTAKVRVDVLREESQMIAEHARQGKDTRGYEVALNKPGGKLLMPTSVPGAIETMPVETVQTAAVASVESVPLGTTTLAGDAIQQPASITPEPVLGHVTNDGRFMPDPVVTHQPVVQTSIYVQAGAFGNEANAQNLSRALSTYGNASVYQANIGGQQFYRVRLGPYQTVDQADQALANVVAHGSPQAVIIVE
jgi:rare lipoprotein A